MVWDRCFKTSELFRPGLVWLSRKESNALVARVYCCEKERIVLDIVGGGGVGFRQDLHLSLGGLKSAATILTAASSTVPDQLPF